MRRRAFIVGLGSAAMWPLAARAQKAATARVGFLSSQTERTAAPLAAALRRGLEDQGYFEGRNVELFYRWADLQAGRLPPLAADLVNLPVAVLVATASNAAALAAKSATTMIPVVFTIGADPVELGLVASLARPGGNVTGVTFLSEELTAKHLGLLHQIVPSVASVAFLVDPTTPKVESRIREAEAAARHLGVRLTVLNATTPGEIEAAFDALVRQQLGALLVGTDQLFAAHRNQVAALAARNRVPAIYPARQDVEAGGLISYGANRLDAHRLAGNYAGRILKGEKPSDIPVQQSVKIELTINQAVARALDLTIPEMLLATADEVIE